MRGLKLNNRRFDLECEEVASFTDAWIETLDFKQDEGEGIVASFTDAWIETSMSKEDVKKWIKSHLLQMRGLKHQYNQLYKYGEDVASFTDAWIETWKTLF